MKQIDLDAEGVTHYQLHFTSGAAVDGSLIKEINSWRSVFHASGWIGQNPQRYRGVGFGNISRRMVGRRDRYGIPRFVVSGTQTGHLPFLSRRHYTTVTRCHPSTNQVWAKGPVRPSSESMTHAMVYSLDRSAHVVIHVHAPVLWKAAAQLRIPRTAPQVPYGTPEMAREVQRLWRKGKVRHAKIFAMGGHRDGIVSFGKTAAEAGLRLVDYGVRALGLKS